jgi:hypothetical protein
MDGSTILGYPVRRQLYQGEDAYFKANPRVTGMAAEDGAVILNPYSTLKPGERAAVALNEALRLHMREGKVSPRIKVTPEQDAFFQGTAYQDADLEKRQTIIARILSGDPSVKATPEQTKEAMRIKQIAEERAAWKEEAAARQQEAP